MNRKDATRELQEQMTYYILTNTSSKRAKQDEKYSYGEYWREKDIRYSPAKLDNSLSQNVHDSRQCQSLSRKPRETDEWNLQQKEKA